MLDELLPEAFATVREACRRLIGTSVMVTGHELTWDMVPYDVQLIGGIVLHRGRIAEMATGEGKTLVATLPLYLNALTGRGAHLVTVNNYLARRDSQWMGHVFRYLGVTVGCIDDTQPSSPGGATPTRPTSPTAPITSSGSTISATTWCSRWSSGSSEPRLCHHRRSGLDSDRRGADSAHHLRAGGARRRREVHLFNRTGVRAGAASRTAVRQPAHGRSRKTAGGRQAQGGGRGRALSRPSWGCRRTSGCSRC